MARVDVYVPEEQLDDARYVLLADEVDATPGRTERLVRRRRRRAVGRRRWLWLVALDAARGRACSGSFLGAVRHW